MADNRERFVWVLTVFIGAWVPFICVNLIRKDSCDKSCETEKIQTGVVDSVCVNKNDSVQPKNRAVYDYYNTVESR